MQAALCQALLWKPRALHCIGRWGATVLLMTSDASTILLKVMHSEVNDSFVRGEGGTADRCGRIYAI